MSKQNKELTYQQKIDLKDIGNKLQNKELTIEEAYDKINKEILIKTPNSN